MPAVPALYDNPRSSNALKVRFLLAELGLEYERREVSLAHPRPAEYLAVNPLGGIPCLVDGDLVLAESNAILRHLARREAREDLYPSEAVGAARVDQWLDRVALSLRPALRRVEDPALGFVPGQGFGAAPPDWELAARRAEEIAGTLAIFDGLVDPSGHALERFTIADCAAVPVLWRTLRTRLDLAPYPGLLRWRETLTARPAFAAAGPVG